MTVPRITARYRLRPARLSRGEHAVVTLIAFLGLGAVATWANTIPGGVALLLGYGLHEAMRPVWAWLRAVE